MHKRIWIGAALAVLAGSTFAQSYPSKTVRLVVPFPPGGVADLVARPLAEKLTATLGQQVIVDNRGGASGTIGAALVAKSPADGYTLLLGTTNELCMSPPVMAKLPYEPTRDFAPVTPVIIFPNILVVNPALPVKTMKEFIALAKSRPGQVSFASSGPGSTNHLTAELFKDLAKVPINHVPYKGGGPALTDLMGGHVEAMFATIPSAVGHIKAGKLKALMVTSDKRARAVSDVPNAKEAGVPGLIVSTWNGVLAPAGTPRDVVTRLNGDIVKAAQAPEMRQKMEGVAAEIYTTSPDEFANVIKRDYALWTKVVKQAGIKLE